MCKEAQNFNKDVTVCTVYYYSMYTIVYYTVHCIEQICVRMLNHFPSFEFETVLLFMELHEIFIYNVTNIV